MTTDVEASKVVAAFNNRVAEKEAAAAARALVDTVASGVEAAKLTEHGQRHINRVWEYTQSGIAVGVTVAMIGGAFLGVDSPVLDYSFFLIVGFYFGRTNHTRVGGVGGSEGTR